MGRNRLFLIETERAGDVTIFSNLCDHEDAKWVTGSLLLPVLVNNGSTLENPRQLFSLDTSVRGEHAHLLERPGQTFPDGWCWHMCQDLCNDLLPASSEYGSLHWQTVLANTEDL
jgi:hypothetical protein